MRILSILAIVVLTYHVVYNTKDLGTWNTLAQAKSTAGTYDGTSFDSSNGPGFPTLVLTRPLSAADRSSLFGSLPPANGPLTITSLKDGKPAGVTSCQKTTVANFDSQGDPGTGTETITFACTAIANAKP